MPEEITPPPAGEKAAPAEAKKAKKADAATAEKPKKEKAPALEDKPFEEFITQYFIPGLTQTLSKVGVTDLELKLEKKPLPIPGMADVGTISQVVGSFQNGQKRFGIGFVKDDIQGQKVFYWADNGAHPSALESFMIDERRVTLDLMVLYAVQRLNGQKWLTGN